MRSLVANQALIQVFEEDNVPLELKNLSSVARLIGCMKNLFEIKDYSDFDPFDISFSPDLEKIARDEKNQIVLDNFNCVRAQTIAVFGGQKLLDLLLLSLNDPFIASLFTDKEQVANVIDSIIYRMVLKGKFDTLLSWFKKYPVVREAILIILIKKAGKNSSELVKDFYRYNIVKNPANENVFALATVPSEDVANEDSKKIKEPLFKAIAYFLRALTATEITDNLPFYNGIVALLYQLQHDLYPNVAGLLNILLAKGVNLNVTVGERDAAIYFFGVRGQELFRLAPADLIAKSKRFLVFLVSNGLDITALQAPPLPLDAPADPVNEAPLAVTQRNYREIIEEDPAFKAALEKAQAEYAQKQIRQEKRETYTGINE